MSSVQVNAAPSGRYTARVKRLRVALPVLAVLVLVGVVLWPHFDPAQAPKRHAGVAPPQMTNSKFNGVDRRNRPYSITSDRAVQKASNSNDIDLTHPVAEITLTNGAWVAISGDQGEYRQDPGLITLEGNVRLFHDQGYEFATNVAAMDLDNGIAWGDQPIVGHGPRGEIEGEGFKMIQDSDKIIFTGKSRLLLRPEEEAANGSEGARDAGLAQVGQ